MSIDTNRTNSALLSAAKCLLDSAPPRFPEADLRILELLLGPESKGARAFINHKFLWPKHVRPIERWLKTADQSQYRLTPEEKISLRTLQALLRPPP